MLGNIFGATGLHVFGHALRAQQVKLNVSLLFCRLDLDYSRVRFRMKLDVYPPHETGPTGADAILPRQCYGFSNL